MVWWETLLRYFMCLMMTMITMTTTMMLMFDELMDAFQSEGLCVYFRLMLDATVHDVNIVLTFADGFYAV